MGSLPAGDQGRQRKTTTKIAEVAAGRARFLGSSFGGRGGSRLTLRTCLFVEKYGLYFFFYFYLRAKRRAAGAAALGAAAPPPAPGTRCDPRTSPAGPPRCSGWCRSRRLRGSRGGARRVEPRSRGRRCGSAAGSRGLGRVGAEAPGSPLANPAGGPFARPRSCSAPVRAPEAFWSTGW